MTTRDGWFHLYPWAREGGQSGSRNALRHCDRAQERREQPEETAETRLADFAAQGDGDG